MQDDVISRRAARLRGLPQKTSASEFEDSGVALPAPDDPAALLPESSDGSGVADFLPITDAPFTGRHVLLVGPAGEICEGQWRTSRKFEHRAAQWLSQGQWMQAGLVGRTVPFEPVGFRLLD